ncbi:hypothetical protein ACB098_02G025600 [Castanea mollissima]
MFFRKQQAPAAAGTAPWTEETEKLSKNKETQYFTSTMNTQNKLWFFNVFLFVFLLAWFLVSFFRFPPTNTKPHTTLPPHHTLVNNTKSSLNIIPTCNLENVSVYVYSLPAEFNLGLLKDCHNLNIYTDMCPYVANCGLGQPLWPLPQEYSSSSSSANNYDNSSSSSWFATYQFIAEMIFHARVENHPCRTRDPKRANLFYVPFYGGLYAASTARESDLKARDALAVRLAEYIESQETWRNQKGKDHFMVLGRTAWDFMRNDNKEENVVDYGANRLLNLPAIKNMSVLTVERQPWIGGSKQHGIPYPSYFHPFKFNEVVRWQKKMREAKRPHLWSFAGAPRKGSDKAAIRDKILSQCHKSSRCELLNCGAISNYKCHKPMEVLSVMRKSEFCLQAPGDSFTRRSTFDAFLTGCIPVFFSPHTAYTQYAWYLPSDRKTYSVYIEGDRTESIEEVLLKIDKNTVKKMRERVIDLIPTLTYTHPNATVTDHHLGFKDAVDVALSALSNQLHLLDSS